MQWSRQTLSFYTFGEDEGLFFAAGHMKKSFGGLFWTVKIEQKLNYL